MLPERSPLTPPSARPLGRIACLLAFALIAAPAERAQAQADSADAPFVEEDTPSSARPPYTVLGHKRLVQRLVRGERAWTLGDAGDIIAWRKDEDWRPTGVRRIEGAQGLALSNGRLLVQRPDAKIRFLHPDTLALQDERANSPTWRCGNDGLWRQATASLLCLDREDGAPRCAPIDRPVAEALASCSISAAGACLTLSDEQSTRVFCASEGAGDLRSSSHVPTRDLAFTYSGALRWLTRAGRAGWEELDQPNPQTPLARQRERFTCVDTRASTIDGCASVDAASDLAFGPVVVPRLLEIVRDRSGLYFVFADGWLRVQPTLESAASVFEQFTTRRITPHAERVWVSAEILGVSGSGEEARIALCEAQSGRWELRDITLHNGISTPIDRGRGECPTRVDYRGNEVVYSSEASLRVFDLAQRRGSDAALEAPFSGSLPGVLRAESIAARQCPSSAWLVKLASDHIGSIPLAAPVCANTLTMLRWDSESGLHEGPGVLLVSNHTSTLHLIDENTLQIFSLRVTERLSQRTRVHLDTNGTWLLSDPERASALRVSADLRSASSEDSVVVLGRVWAHQGGGVYRDASGTTLFVSDAGVVINETGLGPVARRVVREDLRPLDLRAEQLQATLRALMQTR